ncbi:universal stress protein [Arthrobacter sp. BB-1]|uniref:universal stress protein n=1 Tax=Micrococcaceae TaxID=1268 RepID=UPI0010ED0DF3|nr:MULTISPECIES: universal stress protein [Micrococcaceae]TNB72119.1 universal stress protein [Arthrobacter sp. BB-1]UEL27043.1 universal stress protein [Pseudarthrobacter sp. L1SW]VII96208.1 Universal stress protein family [Arthrobacter sp. DR-2P]
MDATKPIAVGIIDSSPSNAALLWAAARARRLKLPLAVLHVLDDRWMAGEALDALPYIDALRNSALDMLKEAGERVRAAEPDLQVTTELLEGSVGGSLGDYSKNASMLVLGSSGHSRAALTDRALQAAATAECPVAVIGTNQGGGQGVVVGVDGSRESTQAVAFAASEADALGEELTVLYAFTGPNRWIKAGLPSSSFAEHVVEEEQIVLSETVAGLRQDYPGLVVHGVLETVLEPADALVQAAANARMLVLGSRGRGGFGRLLLGSTAHGVLTQPPCPTVITRLKKTRHEK